MTRSWVEQAPISILGDDGDDRIWVGLHLAFADTVEGGNGSDSSDGDANDVLSER